MRHSSSRRDDPAPEPLWRRLDRAAGEVNPFLMLLAIGLVILYLTSLFGLLIKLPITYGGPSASSSAIGSVGTGDSPSGGAIGSGR
jgi:hypothetical protein